MIEGEHPRGRPVSRETADDLRTALNRAQTASEVVVRSGGERLADVLASTLRPIRGRMEPAAFLSTEGSRSFNRGASAEPSSLAELFDHRRQLARVRGANFWDSLGTGKRTAPLLRFKLQHTEQPQASSLGSWLVAPQLTGKPSGAA
jgi:hypothetical protein